MSTSATQGGHN